MNKVKDRIALVTAAADGIGASTASLLAEEGAVVVVTDINGEGAVKLADDIGGIGLEHDAGSEADWNRVIGEVTDRYGRLDILVNNAGIGAGIGDIEHQTLDDYRAVMRVCLDSVFIGSKLAIELMKRDGGAIVNVSSVHGIRAAAHEAAYSAGKGAVRLLTKSIALYCAQSGYRIRANSVHPGYILTTMMKEWMERSGNSADIMAGLVQQHPIGFLGEPRDVANGILYLASDDARFVTGSELVIDGGFML